MNVSATREEIRQTKDILEVIEQWEGTSKRRPMLIKFTDGCTTREILIGDPHDRGEIKAAMREIVYRHINAMRAEVISSLKSHLPIPISD